MQIGPIKINWKKKEMPSWLAPHMGGFFTTGKRGPKSEKEALDSVVGWAFACIDAIASRAASIPYRLYRDLEPVPDEKIPAFFNVWNKPNPVFPAWHMRYLLFAHLQSAGSAYWYLYDGGLVNPNSMRSVPKEVWPLEPNKVKIEHKAGQIHYVYHSDKGKIELEPERLLCFSRPNVSNMFDSWSPLRAAGVSMDISEFVDSYQWHWFKNGSWFPYALTTDQNLQDNQLEMIRSEW